jgi:rod shape-determining protein MreC
MEHSPPPFFRTGPTPLARLLLCSSIALVLLVVDARFSYLGALRKFASVIVYPVQRLASSPANILRRTGEFFVSQGTLREENTRLRQEGLVNATQMQEYKLLAAENAHLRNLLGAREKGGLKSTLAEVLYAARDPFSRRIVLDKGTDDGIAAGQPIIDHAGVVGQVTRVYPWMSEATLITDKDQLVPVLNPRNGMRAVLAGTGNDGQLELRFVPLNADFQSGDELVTSGIDGVYPAGLSVARVTQVERNAAMLFARVFCTPVAGVTSYRHVLIVGSDRATPERPVPEEAAPRVRKPKRGK